MTPERTDGGPLKIEVVGDVTARAIELFAQAAPRTVALAGGSTPRATYEGLAAADLAWEGVDVFFGDERCVPQDDPDSNYRMAFESLLQHVPSATAHPMSDCDPQKYAATLARVCDVPPGGAPPRLDFVFLGLGPDGHTASLFPGNPVLDVADQWVALVERPDHQRMTLTYPVLNAAKLVVFLVEGAGKREALRLLREGGDIPAAGVRAERVIVLADHDAAGAGPPTDP